MAAVSKTCALEKFLEINNLKSNWTAYCSTAKISCDEKSSSSWHTSHVTKTCRLIACNITIMLYFLTTDFYTPT